MANYKSYVFGDNTKVFLQQRMLRPVFEHREEHSYLTNRQTDPSSESPDILFYSLSYQYYPTSKVSYITAI
ncbi:hypothetical protein M408DRAFT_193138 [Serendipita vermifera MAFF 305830]|uniref:Uncharacterized protein n=1 Tax=Serendipita vermifera MAFF 305830 TaxID=933852 RepID=A0A0C3APC3_SERVB|nr:hypothetical protein M408DRAFT_193138 [Serendipita vermifera MAFF 305830]